MTVSNNSAKDPLHSLNKALNQLELNHKRLAKKYKNNQVVTTSNELIIELKKSFELYKEHHDTDRFIREYKQAFDNAKKEFNHHRDDSLTQFMNSVRYFFSSLFESKEKKTERNDRNLFFETKKRTTQSANILHQAYRDFEQSLANNKTIPSKKAPTTKSTPIFTTSTIVVIADYIGEQIYKRDFPVGEFIDTAEGITILDRSKVMNKSPQRIIHGFDNAVRSAALVPHIVYLMRHYVHTLPEEWKHQLDTLDDDSIKALQVVALMRASGRHYKPTIGQNPDFDNGSKYARYGQQECLEMLHRLEVPIHLNTKALSEAVVGNEYVGDHYAFSKDKQEQEAHKNSKNNLFSLILNVCNVLETTRDLRKKNVYLNWMPVFNALARDLEGKHSFLELVKKHVGHIEEHQGYLHTKTLYKEDDKDCEVIAGDTKSTAVYDGKHYSNAQQAFDIMDKLLEQTHNSQPRF